MSDATAKGLEPGIYFGLHEGRYHALPALGSSNKKALIGDVSAFWWNSWMNDARGAFERDSPALFFGTALHVFVLYGRQEFFARYGRCTEPGNVKAGKDERARFEAFGMIPMPVENFDRIAAAGTMIRANRHIHGAFSGGASEVTVIYDTIVAGETVREKARFDYLKPRAITDLKSHSPQEGLRFSTSCHRAIDKFDYSLQAAAYMQARARLAGFVADGAVYGDHDSDWLKLVADQPEWAFCLIFWSSTGAPQTWGGTFSPNNPLIREAEMRIDQALLRFVECRQKFGTDEPWIEPEPLDEIDPEGVKNWYYRDTPKS